eukprot:Em0023g504a
MAFRMRILVSRWSNSNSNSVVFKRRFSPMTWYNQKLEKSPLVVKSITTGALFGVGDVFAQLISKAKGDPFDWKRTRSATIYGTFIFGPLAHYHLNFIDWFTRNKLKLAGLRMALVKMVIDQFTYWTPLANVLYLFTLPLLEGRDTGYAKDNVRRNLLPILKVNWMVWPLVQIVNFSFVPVAHQLNVALLVSWCGFHS